MRSFTATPARRDLDHLVDETTASHEPILITGEPASAVLIAEAEWRAIQETVYLLSIPGMRESIREGMGTGLADCIEESV